jgi:FKBP-type peptidyl-prolyl cis-trans isomerase
MRIGKVTLLILILALGYVSCKKDDNGDITTIEIRDRTEQQILDNDSILGYLQTHYYNKSEFEGSTNPKISNLIITEITDEIISSNADSLLINAVETKTVTFAETEYEYYILRLNQGGGTASPTFADNVIVNYEGFFLDEDVFDSAVTPITFDLVSVIPAWRKVLPQFNVAESFVENGDGTVDYINHGSGVMFVPSGLAYFASPPPGISSYSPLVFKFDLYKMFQNDHDRDGIPSYLEDLNGDGEFTANLQDSTDDSDDDTDGDGNPDFFDSDDDGDGILTINEDLNKDGDPTNDIGANGIPNYLDPTETASKNDN